MKSFLQSFLSSADQKKESLFRYLIQVVSDVLVAFLCIDIFRPIFATKW